MRHMQNNHWLPELFNDLMNAGLNATKPCTTAPAINVMENENTYVVQLAAPGLKKEDFFVNINDEGNLIIKMEQKEEEKKENEKMHYLRREFSYTKYEQTLILPDDVAKENISAKVTDGILHIELPRLAQAEKKIEHKIAVS